MSQSGKRDPIRLREFQNLQLCMERAIRAARKASSGDEGSDPRVGAVIVKDGVVVGTAFRGQQHPGEHAEFTLIQKKIRSTSQLAGATLYTTLEPCTTRTHNKLPCADWIIEKKIGRVVIGLLDPNPTICGRGYWRLRDAGVAVEFAPRIQVERIASLNKGFIAAQRRVRGYTDEFSDRIARAKTATLTPYLDFGWNDSLSLLLCPHLREGWALTEIQITKERQPFILPAQHKASYAQYVAQNEGKNFDGSGRVFMLVTNPKSFTDSPSLKLFVREVSYAEVQYYRDRIAPVPSQRGPLIEDLIRGSLQPSFAHSLCMHLIVVTADNKILLTQRSPKVGYHQGLWSASIEEQLSVKDFRKGRRSPSENWAARALREELGLSEDSFGSGAFRVLSVFLEADVLNVSLCGFVEIRAGSDKLESIIRNRPREDNEFTACDFLPFERERVLVEVMAPKRQYHPTSAYRLMMAYMKRFGMPKDSEFVIHRD